MAFIDDDELMPVEAWGLEPVLPLGLEAVETVVRGLKLEDALVEEDLAVTTVDEKDLVLVGCCGV